MRADRHQHGPAGRRAASAPDSGAREVAAPRLAWLPGAAAIALVLATIAGFAGRVWWGFDILGQPRPHYALLLALLAAALAAARSRRLAATCALASAVNLAVLAPHLSGGPPADGAGAPRLSIFSLNVKIRGADPEAVAAFLRAADVDVAYFYAVVDPWLERLVEAGVPHDVVISRGGRGGLEIAVLSRIPPLESTVHDWGDDPSGMAAEVVLPLGARRVRILGTHPVSPRTPRMAKHRDRQLERVAAWAAGQEDPVVVVGDLNVTPWSHAFRRLLDEGGLRDAHVGVGLRPSWPSVLGPLGIPIDHALHSEELVVVDRALGPSFGSEHRSVLVTVAPAE